MPMTTIKSFLITYWSYVTTAMFAIWTIYLYFKANKTERKKNLQIAYIELTKIIIDFQVNCLKQFQMDTEVMLLKLNVSGDINNAEGILKNVKREKTTEFFEKKDEFRNSLKKIGKDFELTLDNSLKDKLQDDINLKIDAVNLLIKDAEEESEINKSFLDKAKDIQQIAATKLSNFQETMPQRVVSLSSVVISLINGLNGTSGWQLIASKSTIEVVRDLEASAFKLNSKISESVYSEVEKVNLKTIINTEEFKTTLKLSEKAIIQMRSEIL